MNNTSDPIVNSTQVLTGWVGFAWATDNSLRKSEGPSDTLEPQFFSSVSIEFLTKGSAESDDNWEVNSDPAC